MPDDLRLEAALSRLVLIGERMAMLLTTLSQDDFVQAIYRRNAERDAADWNAAIDEFAAAAQQRSATTESPQEDAA